MAVRVGARCYLVVDTALRIVAASDAYLAATMTSREAILGRDVFEVFPDDVDGPAGIVRRSQELREADRRLRRVIDAASDAFVGMDAAGRITEWNRQAEATFGWRRDEALGRNLADTIVPPSQRHAHKHGLERFLATGRAHILNERIEIAAIDRGGRELPVELTVWTVDDGTDEVSFHAFVHDISTRRAYEDALRDSASQHRLLADQLAAAQQIAGIGSWEWDVVTNSVSWSDELCRILGVEPGRHPATYDAYLARVHPDDRAMVHAAVQDAVASGRPFTFDHRIVRPGGGLRIVHSRGDVTLGEDGTAVRMAGTAQDVTESEAAAEALRRSQGRLAQAQRTARLGSWEWDIAAGAVTWSDELFRLLGLDPAAAGVDSADFVATYAVYLAKVHPDDRELAESAIGVAIETGEEFTFDHRVVRPGGAVAWVEGRVRADVGPDGVPTRVYGTAIDVTQRVTLQRELAALALYDDLTGLHNRRGFVTLADHQLKIAGRSGRSVPMLFVDVDGMKTINDMYGHAEGDQALIEVATFLRSALRASDLVARIGGDEFCILMLDGDTSHAPVDVERVVAELRAGPQRSDRRYGLGLSVGVAHLEAGSWTSVEDLMQRADGAMYADKSANRPLARVLVVEDDAGLRRLAQLSLRDACDVVTAATGRIALREAGGRAPDLVLLDLNLPDLHGSEVLRQLRDLPGGDRMAVIVMTAGASRSTELESLHDGVDDFIAKPIDFDILEARIKNVLHRTSARPRRPGA